MNVVTYNVYVMFLKVNKKVPTVEGFKITHSGLSIGAERDVKRCGRRLFLPIFQYLPTC